MIPVEYRNGVCDCGKPAPFMDRQLRCQACRDNHMLWLSAISHTRSDSHCTKCGDFHFLLAMSPVKGVCIPCIYIDKVADGAEIQSVVSKTGTLKRVQVTMPRYNREIELDDPVVERPSEDNERDRFSRFSEDEGPFYIVNDKNQFYRGPMRYPPVNLDHIDPDDYHYSFSPGTPAPTTRWTKDSTYALEWALRQDAFRVLDRLRKKLGKHGVRVAIVPEAQDEETRKKEAYADGHGDVADPDRDQPALDWPKEGLLSDAPGPGGR